MPTYESHETDAGVVADLMSRILDVQKIDVNGGAIFAVPEGVNLEDYSKLLPNPIHTEASPAFEDVESFGNYVAKYKNDDTIIIAFRPKNVMLATIDYHGVDKARWGKHQATYKMAFHEDWLAWQKLTKGPIGQIVFAEAIEDMMHTIAEPDAAVLRDMVLKFQSLQEVRFTSIHNLQNGNCKLAYSEEDRAEETTVMPAKMTLILPVYEGQVGSREEPVEVRIRYRASGGKLAFELAIIEESNLLRKAFVEQLEAVEALSGIKPYLGA